MFAVSSQCQEINKDLEEVKVTKHLKDEPLNFKEKYWWYFLLA